MLARHRVLDRRSTMRFKNKQRIESARARCARRERTARDDARENARRLDARSPIAPLAPSTTVPSVDVDE